MSNVTRLNETGTLDDMLSCPYVPSHVMAASRFTIHVISCRKQNPTKAEEIENCPYNQFHFYRKEDVDKHMAVCAQYHHFENLRARRQAARKENVPETVGNPALAVGVTKGPSNDISEAEIDRRLHSGRANAAEDEDYAEEWNSV